MNLTGTEPRRIRRSSSTKRWNVVNFFLIRYENFPCDIKTCLILKSKRRWRKKSSAGRAREHTLCASGYSDQVSDKRRENWKWTNTQNLAQQPEKKISTRNNVYISLVLSFACVFLWMNFGRALQCARVKRDGSMSHCAALSVVNRSA